MQPLTEEQVSVNGLNWEHFNRFGIQVDPRLSVEPSELGGTGLFFHSDEAVQDLIIARIPSSITFDLESLMQRFETLKEIDPEAGQIVKQVLANCKGRGETEIVADFLFSFMIVITNRAIFNHNCPVQEIEFYLEVLSQTDVGMLDLSRVSNDDPKSDHDHLFRVERSRMQDLQTKHEAIVEAFKNSNPDLIVPTFEEYHHIFRVIRSRVLEIPKAVLGEDDTDDFVVNTTLVPFLDFANHQESNNAYFDVDRVTNDVLLKYSGPPTPPGKTHEVCISYSDISSVQRFVSIYGFVPEAEVQLFEVKFTKYEINHFINEIQHTEDVRYDLIMKWLEILPTVQFIITKDKVGVNHQFNPIPFWYIFTQPYEYRGLPAKVDASIVNDPDILTAGVSEESVRHIVEFQEEECDVIQGIDKIAITPHEIDEVNISQALEKFDIFIRKACKYRDVTKETGLTGEYLTFKYQIFERILSQEEDLKVPVKSQWGEVTYPVSVIYNYLQ